MSLRTVMIFPEFENMYVIDPVRNRYDPLAKLVRPHITIVFPFESEMSNEELFAVLDRRLAGTGPFDIELQGFTKYTGPDGNYLLLNMTKGAEEIMKIHDELYRNEFKPFDKGLEYMPHITVGKLETEAALDDAYSTVKYKRDVFACKVNKISVEMIGEHEESIIILEKELKPGAEMQVVSPVAGSSGNTGTVAPAGEPATGYEEILKAVKDRDYANALTLLDKADTGRDNACFILLMLLSAYKVSSTEELMNRVIKNGSLTKHLLEREELKILTAALAQTDNRWNAHLVEYCILGLRRSDLRTSELYKLFRTDPYSSKPKQMSTFQRMDREDMHNFRRTRALENAESGYEFDFFDELSDIGVKYKGAVSNPERTLKSVAAANLSLLADLAVLGVRADIAANPYDDESGSIRYLTDHDYGVNEPPVVRQISNVTIRTNDNAMTDLITALERTYKTDSDRQARQDELIRLIRQDEDKILKGIYRI